MAFTLYRKATRLVGKNGECLVVGNIPVKDRIFGYIGDSFTGYVDLRWRYHLLIFFGTFFIAWNVVGLFWFSTAVKAENDSTSVERFCIRNMRVIAEAILFSYETQSTVGYGYRNIGSRCNVGDFILQILQIFFGVLLPTLVGGVVFVKSRRPKKIYETIVFSKYAVIFDENIVEKNERNNFKSNISDVQRNKLRRVFQFRLGNIRQSHIVSSTLRVILVKDRHTNEGEVIPFCMHQLPIRSFAVEYEDASEHPCLNFLTWPVLISHEVCDDSPLINVGKSGVNFEVVVLLEGVIEPTGKPTQFRTSYTPNEIKWQHKFMPVVMEFHSSKGERDLINVDYSAFNETVPLHTTFSHEEIIPRVELHKCPLVL